MESIINRIKYRFAMFVILGFAVIGLATVSLVVHEYVHKWDYAEVSSYGEMALFILPDNNSSWIEYFKNGRMGSYAFMVEEDKYDEFLEVEDGAEVRAYSSTIPILIVFVFCMFLLIDKVIE